MEAHLHPRSIVILDFGGQYAHLIARRVRECGAFSAILPPETSAEELKGAAGIILSGGPQSVYDKGSPQADVNILELGIPVLGICYGHQWLAHALGGTVTPGKTKEYGHTVIHKEGDGGAMLEGLPDAYTVWMSHGDEVSQVPSGFTVTATSDSCQCAAMADASRKFYGVQFHLEVVHTEHGTDMLRRFVDLCDPAPWSVHGFADRIGKEILQEVGDKKVFMMVSGGVDSTVAFTLLNKVLGPSRVTGLLVETGMMRKSEAGNITDALRKVGVTNLYVEDAADEFFAELSGITEPEAKRKVIGDTFLQVQKRVSEEMGLRMQDGWMLGQGTIYPDTIETGGTKHADAIKTHHNRVEAVQKLIEKGLVIEPLKELYKDEVRRLGEELGLPHDLVWRHPFPGPGLGVRILCAKDEGTSEAQNLPGVEVPHVQLPIQSVGVQGDGRTYRHAVALFAKDPCVITDAHKTLATEIPNRHHSVNRVLLCTSHSEPVTLRRFPMTMTRQRADLLREADAIVHDEQVKANLYEKIWQFPVVLLPVGINPGGQSIVLRPVESQEAMTANAYMLSKDVLERITRQIMDLPDIDAVFMDLTNKPPGTIEWE